MKDKIIEILTKYEMYEVEMPDESDRLNEISLIADEIELLTEPARPGDDEIDLAFHVEELGEELPIPNPNDPDSRDYYLRLESWRSCANYLQHHTPTDQSAPVREEASAVEINWNETIKNVDSDIEKTETEKKHMNQHNKKYYEGWIHGLKHFRKWLTQYATSVKDAQVQDGEE